MPPKNLNDHQIKVIIFDCDGVMFDSRDANIAYYNAILVHFAKPPLTNEEIEKVHMFTAEESINYLFRDDPRLPEAQKFRRKVDYQKLIPLMVMEPFLEEVLGALKIKYHLAIATNRTNTIHPILTAFKLSHFFDLVVSSLDVHNPKPHPEAIFKILNYFNIDAQKAVYVGDSVVDQETAREAKIFFIAYKNLQLDADYYINSLSELLVFC